MLHSNAGRIGRPALTKEVTMNQPLTKDSTRAKRRENAKRKDRRGKRHFARTAAPYVRPSVAELEAMTYDEMQDALLLMTIHEED